MRLLPGSAVRPSWARVEGQPGEVRESQGHRRARHGSRRIMQRWIRRARRLTLAMSIPGEVGAVDNPAEPGSVRLMEATALDRLFASLHDDGYSVIGPTARDGAIVLDELAAASDLPFGWGVRLAPGGYH